MTNHGLKPRQKSVPSTPSGIDLCVLNRAFKKLRADVRNRSNYSRYFGAASNDTQ
jgi:hypothetical protein